MGLAALTAAIDALDRDGPESVADPESLVALHRQLARLEALIAAADSAFDAGGAWAADGARNAAAWIATRTRTARVEARRRLALGKVAAALPALGDAWSAGDVSGAHVGLVGPFLRGGCVEALERDQGLLVHHAKTLSFADFSRVVRYWGQHADPDGTEDAAARRRGRRDVYLTAAFDGMWLGKITLDPIAGAIVADELERLELAHFDADRAEAQERLGRDPLPGELARSPGQRRADALVDMARRSRTAPADGRRPVPLFSVFVGYETLHGRICELAQGIPVAPGSLLPWLEEADVERVVFTPGKRVEVGAAARFFTGATRRGIELRDRRCTHPYLDRPAYLCQVDHIVPYAVGGPTTRERGRTTDRRTGARTASEGATRRSGRASDPGRGHGARTCEAHRARTAGS